MVSLWTKRSSIDLGSGRKRFGLAAEGGVCIRIEFMDVESTDLPSPSPYVSASRSR